MNFTANIVKKSLKVHLSITTSSAVEDHVGANKLQNSYSAKIVVRSFSDITFSTKLNKRIMLQSLTRTSPSGNHRPR